MEWLLEIVLVVLLAATLFQAVRLERALGVLKRDRVALEELVGCLQRQHPPGRAGHRTFACRSRRRRAASLRATSTIRLAEGRPAISDRARQPARRSARPRWCGRPSPWCGTAPLPEPRGSTANHAAEPVDPLLRQPDRRAIAARRNATCCKH